MTIRCGDEHPSAHPRTASDGLGWRHVHAGTWSEVAETDAFEMPVAERHRIVLVTGGRYVIESRRDGRWHRALYGPGSVGMTAAGASSTLRWRAVTGDPMTSLHVYLDPSVLDAAASDLSGRRVHPDALHLDDDRVMTAVRELGWALERAVPALYADSAAHVLAARLVTAGSAHGGPRRPVGLSASVLSRVVEYMDAHLGEQVTLDDLSAVANLSKHHLLRQFKAAAGVPPHRFLQRMRMEHAARLLVSSELTVASIARMCAYSSDRQFAAAFGRHAGLSPSRYRAARRS